HHRIANQVVLGGGGIEPLERAIRSHGNLAEFAPSALILLGLLELNGLPAWQLWALGGAFTAARISHVHGMLTRTLATRSIGALFSIIIMTSMVGRLATLALWG
ncbi:MAG TPA: MAPEG family protein, partial [Magnetovibrio sp.]